MINGWDPADGYTRAVTRDEGKCRSFLHDLLARVGLDRVTKSRKTNAGDRFTLVCVGPYETNLLFALACKNRLHLLSLLPYLLTGNHLSEADIVIFKRCVETFKSACDELGVDAGLPDIPTYGDLQSHLVTRDRLLELQSIQAAQAAATADDDDDEEQGESAEYGTEDIGTLLQTREAAEVLLQLEDNRERDRNLERAANEMVDPEDDLDPVTDDSEDSDDEPICKRRRRGNRFVLDEASED
jgi:hypothetical protein